MLGYLLAHITYFSRREEYDGADSRPSILKLHYIPFIINITLTFTYLAFAIAGFIGGDYCDGPLSSFMMLLLMYSILMTFFSFTFIYDKFNTRYQLALFHAIGCVYLFTTIGGFIVVFASSMDPVPPDSCRVVTPWLFYFSAVVAVLNMTSALLLCPLSCLHLLCVMCGQMACPQPQSHHPNHPNHPNHQPNLADSACGLEAFVVNCVEVHPELFLLGSVRGVR